MELIVGEGWFFRLGEVVHIGDEIFDVICYEAIMLNCQPQFFLCKFKVFAFVTIGDQLFQLHQELPTM